MKSLLLEPPNVFPATVAGRPVQANAVGESSLGWSEGPGKGSPHALRWNWAGSGELDFKVPIGFVPWSGATEDNKIATFSFWVYCQNPMNGRLRFSFGRGEAVDCWFDFRLGFTGWRTTWVAFERDMQGAPHPEMDRIWVSVVDGPATGEILLDCVLPCALLDRRYHDQDEQVPFVNDEAARRGTGMFPLVYSWSRLPAPPAWEPAEAADCEAEIEQICERLDGILLDATAGEQPSLESIFEQAAQWGFDEKTAAARPSVWQSILFSTADNHAKLQPPPGYSDIAPPAGVSFSTYVGFMLKVARAHRTAQYGDQQDRLRRLFLELDDHLVDQGWAAGHATGTMALFGYWAMAGYGPAYWLMREQLRAAGRLERASMALAWFYGAGAVTQTTTMKMHNAVLDWLHVLTPGRLLAILMMPDASVRAAWLRQFSDWLAFAVGDNSPGLEGGFKADGSPFHHGGFYMAYSVGAYIQATRLLYVLSRTRFRVDAAAHAHLRASLLKTRLFSNLREWPPSLCGRGPGRGSLPVEAFAWLALAGTPSGDQTVDEDVARAYLRLCASQPVTRLSERIAGSGLTSEPAPEGHWDMNYGALAIHRRGEWAATAKGHSRYVWSHETYPGENMFGRYQSHGALFVANCGLPISPSESGFRLDGWDWNRPPGTTTVHLPWDELRADLCVVDSACGREEMLFSDESLAGGAHFQQRQGVFGLNLHGHAKYCADFRALKSVFFFDDRLICLGSGIQHSDAAYPVETTLFQAALPEHEVPLVVDGRPITEFPWGHISDGTRPVWLLNHLRQGYYVHGGVSVHLRRERQTSPAPTGGEMTEGDFVSAWIDHGCAPQDASYAYCVVVDTDTEQMAEWSAAMGDPERAHYRILQHDRQAHAVYDRATGVTASVIFAPGGFSLGPVTAVSKPCLLMFRTDEDGLELSVCNPNLNFQGEEPPRVDEFTPYSLPWLSNPSRPDPVEVFLNGRYELTEADPELSVSDCRNTETTLRCECRHGLTYSARLRGS